MLLTIMQTGELDTTTILVIAVLMMIGFVLGLIPVIGAAYAVLIAIAFFITGADEFGIILIAASVWAGGFLGAIVTFVFGGPLWYSPNLFVSTILIVVYLFIFLLTFFGTGIESVIIGMAVSAGLGSGLAFAMIKAPEINRRLDCRCATIKGKKVCAGNLSKCDI